MISSLMFIWLRSTLPQFASYLSSFKTDPSQVPCLYIIEALLRELRHQEVVQHRFE